MLKSPAVSPRRFVQLSAGRGLPILAMLCMMWTPGGVYGQVVIETSGDGIRIRHPGPGTLVNLQIGSTEVARLNMGEDVWVNEDADAQVQGRFSSDTWPDALQDVSDHWAEFHLRTAGFYLDVLHPGPEGDPREAANVAELLHLDVEILADWDKRTPIAQRLLARAGRHASPAYVLRLMASARPMNDTAVTQGPYQGLDSVSASIRSALEAHGRSSLILNGLRSHPAWAADRGLVDERLLDILEGNTPEPTQPNSVGVDDIQAAMDLPDRNVLHRLLISVALLNRGENEGYQALEGMACVELDRLSGRMSQSGRWMATEAYLRLVVKTCGDTPAVRDRMGEYYRRRAEECTQVQDLVGAVDWMSAAYWISQNRTEKQFLAESLAELSILRFRAKDVEAGRKYLDRARDLDPLNERVLEASEYEPEVDPRARIGVGIIIILLAFFAFRRLRKIWSRQ